MNFNIVRTDEFSRHLKQLAKKYPSVKSDYENFLISLNNDPLQGTPLGKDCYKIRWNISSKRAGKRGGARIITYVKVELKKITLLDVYDKADKASISDKEIAALLKKAN